MKNWSGASEIISKQKSPLLQNESKNSDSELSQKISSSLRDVLPVDKAIESGDWSTDVDVDGVSTYSWRNENCEMVDFYSVSIWRHKYR